MNSMMKKAIVLVSSATGVLLILGSVSIGFSQSANAKQEFSAETGKPCGLCHANPAGGGKLKPFGEKFKANGFKLPK